MAELKPEEMEEMQEQVGQGEGDVTALAQQVGQGLSQLAEKINASAATSPEEAEQMSSILNMYIDLIENKLGGQGGEPEQEPMPPVAPAQAGLKGVPIGPNTRQ